MLKPYPGTIRNIAFIHAHCGRAEENGNRIYEIAASVIAPDRPEETFSSLVCYGKPTERDRHASGVTREALRTAPSPADVAAFLASRLRETDIVVTLNPREQIDSLLACCGNPRVVDLRFAAEFFLPQADSSALKPLWEHLHGKPRQKFSFTAREAVELAIRLVRHIGGSVLNPAEFPAAATLRFHLGRSQTLFGDLFLHLNRHFRDYFGGLFDPAEGSETADWMLYLKRATLADPPPECEKTKRKIRLTRIGDLYRGLAATARGFTLRPSQIDYAGHVASALNDGAVLTIEAGTGTGKTQGYLIPVMEFLRLNPRARLAVSTYTKNLQEQIIRREIPLTHSLNRAYRKIPSALLKGKSNYICAEKLDHLYEDALSGSRLIAWLYFVNRVFHFRRADGDTVGERVRLHLNDGLFFRRLHHEISARSGCPPRHLRCPAQVVAAEARSARLIVTNHHKLALLGREETPEGFFENCVIDEANHFEGAVRSAFGIELASREIADSLSYLESVLRRMSPAAADLPAIRMSAALNAVSECRDHVAGFATALAAVRGKAASRDATILPAEHPAFHEGKLKRHLADLRTKLRAISGAFSFVKDPDTCLRLEIRTRTVNRLKTALRDLRENAMTLKTICEKIDSPGHVTTGILFFRHWVVSVHMVEVADLLRDHLYKDRNCIIFTSATLRHGESFDGFRAAAGLGGGNGDMMPHRVPVSPAPRFEAIPSPFDPAAAAIAVPERAVSGAFECKDTWLSRVAELLPDLIRRNRGRTLVLFSSYEDLDGISERVADEIRDDGYPLLLQQSGVPTAALCDEFRAIHESVLFGVDTFWYGVDFPGDTLTQVIITRIPFAHPQDPLQMARRLLLSREEYWRRYRYETAIKLRQGIGRLIRSESDRGRIVILDARYRRFSGEGVTP